MNNITTIQATIYQVIAEQLCIPQSEITLDSNLSTLGADSLDMVELMLTLEDTFDIEIDEVELWGVETVQQVIELVGRLRG